MKTRGEGVIDLCTLSYVVYLRSIVRVGKPCYSLNGDDDKPNSFSLLQDSAAAIDNMVGGSHHFCVTSASIHLDVCSCSCIFGSKVQIKKPRLLLLLLLLFLE